MDLGTSFAESALILVVEMADREHRKGALFMWNCAYF